MELVAAFERHFRLQVLTVTTNTGDSGEFVAGAENHRSVFSLEVSRHLHLIIGAAVTDIMDVQIEMIAPEKWRHSKTLTRAENVARCCLALALGHHPVLDTYTARAWIEPAGDVAGSKNSRHVRFQKFVHQNAVICRDSCFFSKRSVWAYADSNDHQVAIQSCSVIQLHLSLLYHRRCSLQMKFHPVGLMSFANQVAQFTSENLFKRQRSLSDNRDVEFSLAQRCRHFQADEARPITTARFAFFAFAMMRRLSVSDRK